MLAVDKNFGYDFVYEVSKPLTSRHHSGKCDFFASI